MSIYLSGVRSAAQHIMSSPPVGDVGQKSGIEELQNKVERQSLIIQTLLMILLEKKVVQEEEFKEWMNYVDDLDGRRDGRLEENRTPLSCPQCKRNSPRTATKCIYCGHEIEQDFLVRRPEE